jgi:hypothetical protein
MVITEKVTVSHPVKKFRIFMEPECSIPCSQEYEANLGQFNPLRNLTIYFGSILMLSELGQFNPLSHSI